MLGIAIDAGHCEIVSAALDGTLHSDRYLVPSPTNYPALLNFLEEGARKAMAKPSATLTTMLAAAETSCRSSASRWVSNIQVENVVYDPTNAVPLYYQGLAYLDQRKYADAKAALAQAATMDESDAEVLYDLARAAYLSGDPRTAAAALRKLSGMKQSTIDRGKLLRALVVTNAALGNDRTARAQLDEFRALKSSPETVPRRIRSRSSTSSLPRYTARTEPSFSSWSSQWSRSSRIATHATTSSEP